MRRALLSGFLHKNEVLTHYLPEFEKTFADTQEVGAGCPADQNRPRRYKTLAEGFASRPTIMLSS